MKGAAMRFGCVCLLICLTAYSVPAGQPKEAKKDADPLQGTWLVEGLDYNGKDFKDKFKISFVIKGNTMIVEGDGEVRKEYAKMTFKLDPSTTPKCIDLKVSEGVQLDATMEGIYEVKDDQLRICIKVFGQDRPTEFKSPDGGSTALLTLKRKK
jgi:uncharacterized protein (TIGR03067 family)